MDLKSLSLRACSPIVIYNGSVGWFQQMQLQNCPAGQFYNTVSVTCQPCAKGASPFLQNTSWNGKTQVVLLSKPGVKPHSTLCDRRTGNYPAQKGGSSENNSADNVHQKKVEKSCKISCLTETWKCNWILGTRNSERLLFCVVTENLWVLLQERTRPLRVSLNATCVRRPPRQRTRAPRTLPTVVSWQHPKIGT